MRNVKAISFTNEYLNEFNKLNKENNASLLVCELLKEYYRLDGYNFKDIKKDLEYIKLMLQDITTMLEIEK